MKNAGADTTKQGQNETAHWRDIFPMHLTKTPNRIVSAAVPTENDRHEKGEVESRSLRKYLDKHEHLDDEALADNLLQRAQTFFALNDLQATLDECNFVIEEAGGTTVDQVTRAKMLKTFCEFHIDGGNSNRKAVLDTVQKLTALLSIGNVQRKTIGKVKVGLSACWLHLDELPYAIGILNEVISESTMDMEQVAKALWCRLECHWRAREWQAAAATLDEWMTCPHRERYLESDALKWWCIATTNDGRQHLIDDRLQELRDIEVEKAVVVEKVLVHRADTIRDLRRSLQESSHELPAGFGEKYLENQLAMADAESLEELTREELERISSIVKRGITARRQVKFDNKTPYVPSSHVDKEREKPQGSTTSKQSEFDSEAESWHSGNSPKEGEYEVAHGEMATAFELIMSRSQEELAESGEVTSDQLRHLEKHLLAAAIVATEAELKSDQVTAAAANWYFRQFKSPVLDDEKRLSLAKAAQNLEKAGLTITYDGTVCTLGTVFMESSKSKTARKSNPELEPVGSRCLRVREPGSTSSLGIQHTVPEELEFS